MSESVVLALLAVGGTLFGTWLGGQMARRTEDRNWLRAKRLDAYTELLIACDVLIEGATAAYRTEPHTQEAVDAQQRLVDQQAVMYRATDRVKLVGSKKIQGPVEALTLYCGQTLGTKAMMSPRPSADEWKEMRVTRLAQLYRTVRDVARTDLEKIER